MTRPSILVATILALAAPAAADSHEAAAGEPTVEEAAAQEPRADPTTERPAEAETMPEEAPAPGAAPAAEPAGPPPEVARAQFTTAVEGREPTDALERLGSDAREVSFFTELRNFQGQRVVHRWLHEGEVRAEVPFEVEGPRWRVHSSKQLLPAWTGEWTVAVVDEGGEVVAEESFVYAAPAAAPEEAAAPEDAPPEAAAGGEDAPRP